MAVRMPHEGKERKKVLFYSEIKTKEKAEKNDDKEDFSILFFTPRITK
jgi:hypothetical protein